MYCLLDSNCLCQQSGIEFPKVKPLPTGQRLVRAPVTLWVTVSEKMELDVTWAGIPRLTLIELPPLLGVWVARLLWGYFYMEVRVSHVCVNDWFFTAFLFVRDIYIYIDHVDLQLPPMPPFGSEMILSQNIQCLMLLYELYTFIRSITSFLRKWLGKYSRPRNQKKKTSSSLPRQSGAFQMNWIEYLALTPVIYTPWKLRWIPGYPNIVIV